MRSEATREHRAAQRAIRQGVSPRRVIDCGVRCYVVKQDLEHGAEVIPGLAPVASLGHFDLGGMWDTVARRWCGPSERPKIWYCAEYAEPLIRHPDDTPPRILVESGFGAGKTRGILSKWVIAQSFRLAEYAGRKGIEILCTSPTDPRLDDYIAAIGESLRDEWWTWRQKPVPMYYLRWGVRLRMLGTAKRSNSQGSRVQGFNVAAVGADELQDNADELTNMVARGRRAPGGVLKFCATSTPKISAEWRTVKAQRIARTPRLWQVQRVDARTNPLVWPQYWIDVADDYSPREFDRAVRGIDVGPERAVYPTWSREHNLRPRPQVGGEDITRQVLGQWGYPNFTLGAGHDPGVRFDATVFFKIYQLPGEPLPVYWVVDELTTERTTTEEHVVKLLSQVRERWGCNRLDAKGKPLAGQNEVHVRLDPFGQSKAKDDKSVKQMFLHHGIDARSAAYRKGAEHGVVHLDAAIEMVCRLLCSASGKRRLFVDVKPDGSPVAPRLVDAFETAERNVMEQAEWEKKGTDEDRSHWPSCVRFFLWPLERLPESRAEAGGRR